jgi:putative ABC transport system permease protein
MFNPGETVPVAEGASLTLDGLERLTESDANAVDDGIESLLVRWAPGVDGEAAARSLGLLDGLDGSQPPSDLARIDEAAGIPWLLTAFVVVIGLTALGYALITGLQARRRDLGVLRAIGFLRRQVSTAIGWQATIVVAIALLLGLPLGIIVGRWSWAVVAANLGVATDVRVPALAMALVVVLALVVANLVAAGPAWAARQHSPADALRSE